MTISGMSTEDFSFDPREVPAFLALARHNKEVYEATHKDPKKEANLTSLRFKGRKIKRSIGAASTDPALIMVIVTIEGTGECLSALIAKRVDCFKKRSISLILRASGRLNCATPSTICSHCDLG